MHRPRLPRVSCRRGPRTGAAGHQESFGSTANQRSFDAATDHRLCFATTTSTTAAQQVPLGRSDRKRTRTVGEQYLRRPVELKWKATCTSSGGPEPAAGPRVSPGGPLKVSVGLEGPPFPAQIPDETLFRAEQQRNQVVSQGYRDPQACVIYRLQALHITRLAIPGPCLVDGSSLPRLPRAAVQTAKTAGTALPSQVAVAVSRSLSWAKTLGRSMACIAKKRWRRTWHAS